MNPAERGSRRNENLLKFGHSKRISGQGDFRRLLKEAKSLRGDWFTLKVMPNGKQDSRFGCAVRRSASPEAVFRNRLKRWFREAFRRNQRGFPAGFDVAIVVFKAPEKASYAFVEQTFLGTWERFTHDNCSH